MTRFKKGSGPTSNGPKISEETKMEFDHRVAADFAVVVMINNEKCSQLLAPHCARLGDIDRMEDFMQCVGLMVAVGKQTRTKIQSRCQDDKTLSLCCRLADKVSNLLNINKYGEY